MRGDVDSATLAQLDVAAQEAAENARAVIAQQERCPACGRPYVEPEELLAALDAADAAAGWSERDLLPVGRG